MLALLAAALLAAGGSPPTAAGDTTVMIERPADADRVLQETTLRLRRELVAAGYGSEVVTCPVDPAADASADACPRDQTSAVISLARDVGATSILVTSRLRSGRELRRHVRVPNEDGGGDATLLAVRAVELLRDLQLEVAQVAAGDDEDPRPVELDKESAPGVPLRWYLWAGGSMLFIPWTTYSTVGLANASPIGPAPGCEVGVGIQVNDQVMLVADAVGPFAASLPLGAPSRTDAPYSDRSVYDVVARLALRLGTRSATQGLFSQVFVGLSYMYADLDSSISNNSRSALAPMVGGGPGYTLQVTRTLLASLDLEVAAAPDLRIVTQQADLQAKSGMFRAFLNLTAAVRLP